MPSGFRSKRWFILAGLLALAAAGVFWGPSLWGDGGRKLAWVLADVTTGPIRSEVSTTGALSAVVTVQVGSQVSGRIQELLADFNTPVTAGQVIARIASETFESRVGQAEADLAMARAALGVQSAAFQKAQNEPGLADASLAAAEAQVQKAQAALADSKRQLDRNQPLVARQAIARSQFDQLRAQYEQNLALYKAAQAQRDGQKLARDAVQAGLDMAQAQVRQAEAQVQRAEASLRAARVDLDNTVIRSPVNGVVIARNVDVGQTVAASLQAPILFLIAQDLGEMQVNANLDEADIGRIRLDQKALFTVDAFPGRMFEGRVSQIRKSPTTIQNVVTYTVIIAAGNPGLVLLPGMTATVRVVVDEKPSVLRVPIAALRFRPESNGAAAKPASGTDADPERASASGTNKGPGTGKGPGAGSGQGRSSGAGGMPGVKTGRENGSETPLPGRVFLPGPDNRPIPVDVMTGLSDGDLTEILPGPLTEGQKVITGQTDPNKPQDRSRPSSPGGFRL